jgi:hypothetical protein
LEAKRPGSQDRDSVRPRPNVFRDAQREVAVAIRRYANRWVPRLVRPGLQITDARCRRPRSNNTERKHGGRGQGGCDSGADGRIVGALTLVGQCSGISPENFQGRLGKVGV